MLATTMGRRGEEMGYNLIRMRIVSGYLAVNAKGLLLSGNVAWMCYTPLPEINSVESQYVIQWEGTLQLAPINNCQRQR